MKNNLMKKIAITVGIVFVIAIIAIIFFFKKEDNNNQEEIVLDENISVEKEIAKKEVKKVDEVVKKEEMKNNNVVEESDELAGWKTYKNDELGISFSYPEKWGKVVKVKFDEIGKTEYFKFSNIENSQLGGIYKEYWDIHPGRGGSLIDPDGFTKGSLSKEYNESGKKIWDYDSYKVSSSGKCAYSTSKNWFDGKVYHAVCNLNNDLTGFNFSFGTNQEKPNISEQDFIKLIESVKIY